GAMDGNVKDTPPVIPVVMPEDRDRLAALEKEIPAAKEALAARKNAARGDFDVWLAKASSDVLSTSLPTDKLYLHLPLAEGEGKTTQIVLDGQDQTVPLAENVAWQAGPGGSKAIQV